MFKNSDEVLKFISDEGVKFVDVRFSDLPGVMQHFTLPAKAFDADATRAERESRPAASEAFFDRGPGYARLADGAAHAEVDLVG